MTLRVSACLFAIALITGCTRTNQDSTSVTPATADRVMKVRESLQAQRPGTMVGPVVAVLTDAPYAAAGDLPTDQFKAGDVVSFVNGSGDPIGATGRVSSTTPTQVNVRYDVSAGGRAPVVGDLLVRFP